MTNGIRFANPFLRSNATERRLRLSRALGAAAAISYAPRLRFDNPADNAAHEAMMRKSRLTFVEGWAFRSPHPVVRQHRDLYRRAFYESNPPVDARRILKPGVTHIAVHVRRGDFSTYEGGKYYYPNSVYFDAIDQVVHLARGGHQILIFTDDANLDQGAFRDHCGDVFVSSLDARGDHYLMSLCDYIVGPPSTFSMWASYIGATKHCHIQAPGQTITESSFSIC